MLVHFKPTSACVEWPYCKPGTQGIFNTAEGNKGCARESWIHFFGVPMRGQRVFQSCANLTCFNPAHLFLSTNGPAKYARQAEFVAMLKTIKTTNKCVEWPHNGGRWYGTFTTAEGAKTCHRESWKYFFGEIPDGVQVLHKCDNPPCFNPRHLFLGDEGTNARDRQNKGRGKFVFETEGGYHPLRKLTSTDKKKIRAASAKGEKQKTLAAQFGVSRTTIGRVVNSR